MRCRTGWTPLLYGSAALALVAAVIHALVTPEHFEEWWGYGMFFLVVAVTQGVYSAALVRWPRRSLFVVGIVSNLAVIALYAVTRTSGIPVGPNAGEIEKVGMIDIASKAAEVLLVAALGYLVLAVRDAPGRRLPRASRMAGASGEPVGGIQKPYGVFTVITPAIVGWTPHR